MPSLVPRSALWGLWMAASPPSSAGRPPETPPPLETGAAVPPRDLRTASARGSSLFPSNSARAHARPSTPSPRLGGFCPWLQGRGGWAHGPHIDTNLLTNGLRATPAVLPSEHVPAI